MKRLCAASLADCNAAVITPSYDRSRLRAGIVHLGVGAFHRAHQAVYTEDAIANSGGDWGIVGVSLRSAAVAGQLLPQDGLYSVLSENAQGFELRVIGVLVELLVAPQDTAAVVAAIARQAIPVMTLTITEKGYTLARDGKSLDRMDKNVAADLQHPEQPVTAVGMLALGLRQRQRDGGAALTIISCDNLSQNSLVLYRVLVEYLSTTFPGVLPWLEKSVTFPCSMVDRIVPAMSAEKMSAQAKRLGLRDEAAVATEPFSQWFIENNFAAPYPDWESAGVRLVEDILPLEAMKLRLLNASHSAIAYCGLLAGEATVDAAMRNPQLRDFVKSLMVADLMPALEAPEGFDLVAYSEELLARFCNPVLDHRCLQIAMDGSEKISQRWLPTLQVSSAPLLVRALSAWCYFVLFTDTVLDDPRSDVLSELRASAAPLGERLAGVLACARLSESSVPDLGELLRCVLRNIERVDDAGVLAMLAD